MRTSFQLVLAITVVGCSDSGNGELSGPSNEPGAEYAISDLRLQEKLGDKPPMHNDLFRAAAELEPWFGGLHIADGVLQISTTDPGVDVSRSRATALIVLQAAGRRNAANLVETARLRPVRFSFANLFDFYSTLLPDLHKFGVTQIDLDEAANRISVGVATEQHQRDLLQHLEGLSVPAEAVEVMELSAPEANYTWGGKRTYIYWNVSVTAPCTLSQVVTRRLSDATEDSVLYGITNSHCTQSFASDTGDRMLNNVGGSTVADEIWDHPLITNATCQGLTGTTAAKCRYSDAALFQYRPASWGNLEPHIIQISAARDSLHGEETFVLTGDSLNMYGSTSGLSKGVAEGSCVHVLHPNISGGYALCQGKASYPSSGGDSGGPVWVKDVYPDLTRWFVGVHWGMDKPEHGDSRYYSKVYYVADEILPLIQDWGTICFSFESQFCWY